MSSIFSSEKITQNTGDNSRVPGWIGLALVFVGPHQRYYRFPKIARAHHHFDGVKG